MMNKIILLYVTTLLLVQVKNIYSTNEEIFETFPIKLDPNSIWKKVVTSSSKKFCGGIFYSDGFQSMCIPELITDTTCDIESKRIDMKNYKGKNLKVTISSIGDACSSCIEANTKNPSLKLLIFQHVGGNTHYNDNLELKSDSNSIVLKKQEGMDAITITLSISRICKELVISISSTVCQPVEKVKDLVNMPTVSLPAPDSTEISITDLNCTQNALVNIKPQFKCFSDGTYEVVGSCQCKPNYELASDSKTCKQCDSSSYKFDAGNQKCTRCMAHSTFVKNKCSCESGYARAIDDFEKISAVCYGK